MLKSDIAVFLCVKSSGEIKESKVKAIEKI